MPTAISVFICLFLASTYSKIFVSGSPRAVSTPSPECVRRCRSCPPTLTCNPGVSLVLDDCGCCKLCARQKGEPCSEQKKCDPHKNLYCTYNDVDENGRTCAVMPGRSCPSGDIVYENGQSFHIGCKVTCTCTDGYIGCNPRCPITRNAAPSKDCLHPRLVKKPGKCCEEWVCSGDRFNNTTAISGPHSEPPQQKRIRFPLVISYNHRSPKAAHRSRNVEVQVRTRDRCNMQTTEWSACSKTCGWGVSDRVVTDKLCKLRKQSRLCQLRPCNSHLLPRKKKGRRCKKTLKSKRRVRFAFSGCQSKLYTPKYCGSCTDGRCCAPKNTVTKSVRFRCADGFRFRKRMMMIKSCSCKRKCGQSINAIALPFRNLGHDFARD